MHDEDGAKCTTRGDHLSDASGNWGCGVIRSGILIGSSGNGTVLGYSNRLRSKNLCQLLLVLYGEVNGKLRACG